MEYKTLDLEKLLRIPAVDSEHGFDISPDGGEIAFSSNPTGQWEIYLVRLDGSSLVRQLTHGPGGKFSPSYSPDRQSLLYLLDLDGGEVFDIIRYDFFTNGSQNLTPETAFSIQSGARWSPDGSQIAFQSDLNGVFDTYVMPAQGGKARKILQTGTPHESIRWSPNGKNIAIGMLSDAQNQAIYIVTPDGIDAQPLCLDGKILNARDACWSPDGCQLVVSAERSGSYQIAIYTLINQAFAWLPFEPGDLGKPDWSPDGKRIAYTVSRGPDTWLATYDTLDGLVRRFQAASGVHETPTFTPDNQKLIFTFDNYAHPCDLWQYDLKDGTISQITHSLPPEFKAEDFILPEHVWYPGLDKTPVPALLFKPKETALELPPAVIVIHGGPSWLFQFLWYPIFQHMASRGWVVLTPNYRGSTGYSRDWQLANRFDLGGVDTRDVAAGVDYLINACIADPQQIAVTGRSHGGYLTMTCLTQFPERFVGGSAIVPFINWFSSHEKIREDLQHWDIENMGDPGQNYQRWYDASPYFFLDRIQAPVQLICGGNDPRCPASDSIAARDRLESLGKQVDFILYQDEGHAFLKIENVVDHELRRMAFLAKLFKT